MFEYFNGILAIKAEALYSDLDILSKSNYGNYTKRKKLKVLLPGHRGQQAHVEYSSLEKCGLADLVKAKLGYDPREIHKYNAITPLLKPDYNAEKHFFDYRYGDQGMTPLQPEVQIEYTYNAIVLNAISQIVTARMNVRKRLNGRNSLTAIIQEMHEAIKAIDRKVWKHTLIYDNYRSLERVYKEYRDFGYSSLIHKNYGNKHALKVTERIEKLLLGIYWMENKPYQTGVLDLYLMFLAGRQQIEYVDKKTGELIKLNSADYFDDNGFPITLSESTINNGISRTWENTNASEKQRNSELWWTARRRPHNHRHAPVFSLSKLTMDDIAIPFKRKDGTRVWGYQIFDTQSTAVVGRAYSVDKNVNLLIESLKDFMYLCVRNGWGIPGQIECEQHLANTLIGKKQEDGIFESDLLTAGTLFTNVTFCRGGMPRTKRAERFIEQKKYHHQAKRVGFLRRPFARLESNILNGDIASLKYKVKDIVKNEEKDINDYNNSLHPDQELYPGKTRWEVFIENINPDLPQPQLPVLAYHIGECNEKAEIHSSQYVDVAKTRFMLPGPSVMRMLSGTTVQAFYFPGENVNEVYIYQNKRYICTCQPLKKYNEAIIERTDEDLRIKNEHDKYVSQFDKITKERVKSVPQLFTQPIDDITKKLEGMPAGKMPLSDEFDEPDLPTQKSEAKEYRKAERERKKINEELHKKHLEYITQTADLSKYE
jgi:hypothetical protein